MLLQTGVLIQLWDFELQEYNWIFEMLANVCIKALIPWNWFPKVLEDFFLNKNGKFTISKFTMPGKW